MMLLPALWKLSSRYSSSPNGMSLAIYRTRHTSQSGHFWLLHLFAFRYRKVYVVSALDRMKRWKCGRMSSTTAIWTVIFITMEGAKFSCAISEVPQFLWKLCWEVIVTSSKWILSQYVRISLFPFYTRRVGNLTSEATFVLWLSHSFTIGGFEMLSAETGSVEDIW